MSISEKEWRAIQGALEHPNKEEQEAALKQVIYINCFGCTLFVAVPAIFACYGMWWLAALYLTTSLLWGLIIAILIADYKALRRREY